jgi:hypothetical protein
MRVLSAPVAGALALSIILPQPVAAFDDTLATMTCTLPPGGVMGVSADESFATDFADGNVLDSHDGFFDFNIPATCDFDDVAGTPLVVPAAPGNMRFRAVGTYTNTTCASGIMDGTFSLEEQAPLAGPAPPDVSILGDMLLNTVTGKLSLIVATGSAGPNYIGTGEGNGILRITPKVGNCANADVTSYTVDGTWNMVLVGEG